MRLRILLLFLTIASGLVGCKKNQIGSDNRHITGVVNQGAPKITTYHLQSGKTSQYGITPGTCYLLTSTVYDPVTKGIGYIACDTTFTLMDPATGTILNQFPLPRFLNQLVIDTQANQLIGNYYENNTNHIMVVQMNNGTVLADNPCNLGSNAGLVCSWFFLPSPKHYVLMRMDSMLAFIDPLTGTVVDSVKTQAVVMNGRYDAVHNRLVGHTFSGASMKNMVLVIDVVSGILLHEAEVAEDFSSMACETWYDDETGSLVLISADNEVLFIKPETGDITERYDLGTAFSGAILWR